MLPRIKVISTGGTIANTSGGRVGIETVLADVNEKYPAESPSRYAELHVTEILREGAETFTPGEWTTIAHAVSESVGDPSFDGVVVTHGTYTAEETAYFLHLAVKTAKPIAIACSQRKHSSIGNDGDHNLLDAVRVVASPTSRKKGVFVILNEEIHCAREVIKTNQRPGGFDSRGSGILGSIESDQVSFYRTPTRRHTYASEFDLPTNGLPRVDIVYTYAGADGTAVEAFAGAGARGIVVNGFAFSGKPHRYQLPALQEAAKKGIAIVLTSRGGNGRIPSPRDDLFVCGDNLTAQKARVLLSLALTKTSDKSEIQRIFDEY